MFQQAIRRSGCAISRRWYSSSNKSSAGIAALEVYFPQKYVEQKELEAFDKVGDGKYTKGLGQTRMAFVDTDREDTASMCMTVFHNLLEKYQIDPKEISRLEVGTETPIDKSKSIKSYLMSVVPSAHTDLEGIDNIHACYGGTAAIFNAMYYLEHQRQINPNETKYAVVVCGDISNYKEAAARPSGGAGVVAMLLSSKDAALRVNLATKASHFEHVYDFFKPDPASPFPVVDGHYSNLCYLRSLDKCYQRFKKQSGKNLQDYDYSMFHSPYNKLVQKSLARLVYNDALDAKGVPSYINSSNVDASKLEQLLSVSQENSYSDKEIEKTFGALSTDVYNSKVEQTHLLSKELGNCYTASLYIGLASLVNNQGSNLNDKDLLMFSYGSGLAASMYEINAKENEGRFSLQNMQKVLNLQNRLQQRTKASVDEYASTVDSNVKRYLENNRQSTTGVDHLQKGTYYLKDIDQMWRRKYERK
ncbi:HMG-CoA synthase [Acrasis kona]|uniref:Hydroxymethylglutaryl-CoA synthase n=1 Tax=Acrasis kona TaxID=1008807 RepID=A0AAW2ZD92_9EUKA